MKARFNWTPQDGLISPILANVYLHYVLDLWFKKCIKKQVYEKDAQRVYEAVI